VTEAAAEVRRRLVAQTVFTPLGRGSPVAETVARLGQAIGMGLLRPGDRLPPETELAEDLGISPVTLRNALLMLRGAGLLVTHRSRGGGTSVAANAAHVTPPELGAELPAERELRDLIDARAVIEGGVAALAAERATETQLAYIDELVGELAGISAYPTWTERDTLLHLVIADATGSPRLVRQISEMRGEVGRLGRLLPVPRRAMQLADREHRSLARAFRQRQPDRARAVMDRHIRSTGALWLGLGRVTPERDGEA
jgi:GntR family transcriptional regulator, transcriptional repressor for pyruvate dehydrogenase complex